MVDRQATASIIISFSERLEDNASGLYRALSARFPEYEGVFIGFAEESGKNKVLLTRTYRETVSDALETGFAFDGVVLPDDIADVTLSEDTSLTVALVTLLEIEEKAVSFYLEVAEQSRALLATIPRAFRRVARRRDDRCRVLRSLIEESLRDEA